MRTSPVTRALAMSVLPTPKARQPSAPLCGGVRVGADDDLAGQRIALGHHRDARCLRCPVPHRPGQPWCMCRPWSATNLRCSCDSIRTAGHLTGALQGAGCDGRRRCGLRTASMVCGSMQAAAAAERLVQHVRAHGRVVLVYEAPVGAHEGAVARLQVRRRVTGIGQWRARIFSTSVAGPSAGGIRARQLSASSARARTAAGRHVRSIAAACASREATSSSSVDRLAALRFARAG